jgi:hypothetical protein
MKVKEQQKTSSYMTVNITGNNCSLHTTWAQKADIYVTNITMPNTSDFTLPVSYAAKAVLDPSKLHRQSSTGWV